MQQIIQAITASVNTKNRILENPKTLALIQTVSELVAATFTQKRRVYFCGNGGSAADAQHLAAEFTGPFYNRNRPALPAEALHCNTSYLTAAANDFDYSTIYARLVQGIMHPGDVLFGLSTSGNSANVVKAFEVANQNGIITIGMTGEDGGQLKALSNYLFNVPSNTTPRIQEAHMLIGHIICEIVEDIVFPK